MVEDNGTILLQMVADGMINRDTLIQDLLNWLSVDEVAQFCEHNDITMPYDDSDAEDE